MGTAFCMIVAEVQSRRRLPHALPETLRLSLDSRYHARFLSSLVSARKHTPTSGAFVLPVALSDRTVDFYYQGYLCIVSHANTVHRLYCYIAMRRCSRSLR